MRNLSTTLFLLLVLSLSVVCQQIGQVDLTQAGAPWKPDGELKVAGCPTIGGGFLDGFVPPPQGKERKIAVEFAQLSDRQLLIDSEYEVQLKLINTGDAAVEIPWNTDPNVTKQSPDPDHLVWQSGEFELSLTNETGRAVSLKSLSPRLFGAKYSAGSERTLAPGQWIVADVRFKVEDEYSFDSSQLAEGHVQLNARWSQTSHSWDLNRSKCEVWRGTYIYRNYYDQESRSAAATLGRSTSPTH